jgi:uncharacterized membrane protein YeiB
VAGVERVVGVDAARGVAVLGMFAAHVGYADETFWSPTGWLLLAQGRSAGTFAVLAGVSMALLSGGPNRPVGAAASAASQRIVARAAVVAVIGYALVSLRTPLAVILPAYAVMFVLALPFLTAARRTLAVAATTCAILGPVLVQAVGGQARGAPVGIPGLLLTGYYPAVVWLAYVLAGLAVGRSELRRSSTRLAVAGVGAALTAVGYGFGALTTALAPDLAVWTSIDPHADTTPEVVGNLGVALLLVALLQSVAEARVGRVILTPLAATGAMVLTVYTAQVVAIDLMGPAVVYESTTNGTLIAFTVVTLVACTLWVRFLGRGPLERLMRAVADLAATPPRPAEEVRR